MKDNLNKFKTWSVIQFKRLIPIIVPAFFGGVASLFAWGFTITSSIEIHNEQIKGNKEQIKAFALEAKEDLKEVKVDVKEDLKEIKDNLDKITDHLINNAK